METLFQRCFPIGSFDATDENPGPLLIIRIGGAVRQRSAAPLPLETATVFVGP